MCSTHQCALPKPHQQHLLSNTRFRHGTICQAASMGCNQEGSSDFLAQSCDLTGFPDCQFLRVEAIIRPWRLDGVLTRLSREGITGATATVVKGVGAQGGRTERYRGNEYGETNLVEKAKLDVVCERSQVHDVISFIIDEARTGEVGDGKVFVHPVMEVVRIRTGECGLEAETMEGGRKDILQST